MCLQANLNDTHNLLIYRIFIFTLLRSSLSEAMAAVEGQHFSRPNSENEPIMSPVETQETFETVTSSVETPLPEITDDDVDDYDDGDSGDNGDVQDDKKGGCGNGVHNEEM